MLKTYSQLLNEAHAQINCVTARSAKTLYDEAEDPIIIDVREEDKVKLSKLTDSINIPRGLVERHIHEYTTPEQVILTHCGAGARASLSALSLQNMGYTNVYAIKAKFEDIKKVFG